MTSVTSWETTLGRRGSGLQLCIKRMGVRMPHAVLAALTRMRISQQKPGGCLGFFDVQATAAVPLVSSWSLPGAPQSLRQPPRTSRMLPRLCSPKLLGFSGSLPKPFAACGLRGLVGRLEPCGPPGGLALWGCFGPRRRRPSEVARASCSRTHEISHRGNPRVARILLWCLGWHTPR